MVGVDWCESLRATMHEELDEVTAEIRTARVKCIIVDGLKIYSESIGFQNVLVNNC